MSEFLSPLDTLKYNAYLTRATAKRRGILSESSEIINDILFADFCGYAVRRINSGEYVVGVDGYEFISSPLLDENFIFNSIKKASIIQSQSPNDPTEVVMIFDVEGQIACMDLIRSISVANILRSKWVRS